MKVTKNAGGEKHLTLTKAEYAALCAKYAFIRNAPVVKSAQLNDQKLPEFMAKVDELYRTMFNMPGGLPDAMKEQIAQGVRSGIKNTQTPAPGAAGVTPPAEDTGDAVPSPEDLDMYGEQEGDDVFPPEGSIDNPQPLGGEDPSGSALQDQQSPSDPTSHYMHSNEDIRNSEQDFGAAYEDSHGIYNRHEMGRKVNEGDPMPNVGNTGRTGPYESAQPEVDEFGNPKGVAAQNIHRGLGKFANGIDFSKLKQSLK
jgi:hypothetical protein